MTQNTLQDEEKSPNLQKRLNQLEATLSELCKANDSLMPLVLITEILPGLARADSFIKNKTSYLSKRDQRCSDFEKQLPMMAKTIQERNEVFMDPKLERALSQLDSLSSKISSMENQVSEQSRVYEKKFREERVNIERNVENFLLNSNIGKDNFTIFEQMATPNSSLNQFIQEVIGEEIKNENTEMESMIGNIKKVFSL